ncbi:uncharacterized protein ACWYII_030419 [Salvelinus alpinus]
MEEHSQRNFECLARAVYATGSPQMLTGNVYWKRFLNGLCPAFTAPTRHALSNHLLDAEFNRVQVKVKQIIEKTYCIAIISDGWSNVRGQGIINYLHPSTSILQEHRHEGQQTHGLYIADELKTVINDLGPQKVFALVTDNAANMKAAWSKVEKSYPHITPIGCAAHAFNLLLKDIVALKTMDTHYKRAKEMVRNVKGHQVIAAIYFTKQSEKNKCTTLKLPSNTRWGGVIMFDSLLKLLKPIAVAIARIEGDNAILSDVQTLLANVSEEIRTALPTSLLLQAEETAVLKYIKKCEDFCLKPIYAAAYMLDPKYAGKSILSGAEINKAYGVITTVSRCLDEDKVLSSLAKYTSMQRLWDGDAIWQSCQHISSATWWKGLCGSEALSPDASIILQIPPTSAASQRNWSLFGNTHSKARNRLTNTRVEKSVAIRANLRLFEPDNEPSSTRLESDSKDEAS